MPPDGFLPPGGFCVNETRTRLEGRMIFKDPSMMWHNPAAVPSVIALS
jgi:hypothetical protein